MIFNEISGESKYYKAVWIENFMIFENPNLIIFQSPFLAKLFKIKNEVIFANGTIHIVSKFNY